MLLLTSKLCKVFEGTYKIAIVKRISIERLHPSMRQRECLRQLLMLSQWLLQLLVAVLLHVHKLLVVSLLLSMNVDHIQHEFFPNV